MTSLPDITVVSPSTYWESEQVAKALIKNKKVCYLRLDKSSGEDPVKENEPFILGKPRVLKKTLKNNIFLKYHNFI